MLFHISFKHTCELYISPYGKKLHGERRKSRFYARLFQQRFASVFYIHGENAVFINSLSVVKKAVHKRKSAFKKLAKLRKILRTKHIRGIFELQNKLSCSESRPHFHFKFHCAVKRHQLVKSRLTGKSAVFFVITQP